MTDGNVIPVPGACIPYTINYNNAGSIVNGTGANAAGVMLTETVPANTIADLANSTPGWTLASGNGGAGSTYTFAVGGLDAGVTGSAVFSVDLNANIPAGTTSMTNNVTITDAAGDTASGTQHADPAGEPGAPSWSSAPAARERRDGHGPQPAVTVAAEDQFGNTFTADSTSTVTLTLNGGTFAGGGNTATATVSGGVATFGNLVIDAARHLHPDRHRRQSDRRHLQLVHDPDAHQARLHAAAHATHRRGVAAQPGGHRRGRGRRRQPVTRRHLQPSR